MSLKHFFPKVTNNKTVWLTSFQSRQSQAVSNLLQVCPSVPPFVFSVSFKPSFNVIFMFHLVLWQFPRFDFCINFVTQ